MITDERGLVLSGATQEQAGAYDAVIREYFDYRLSTFPSLKILCESAPGFAMAHILKGFLLLAMGTQATCPAARACAEHVASMEGDLTWRERLHLRALQAWVRGDMVGACSRWDELLFREKLDLLALKLQHFALFWMGGAEHMRDACARVMSAWDAGMPGYSSLLGMFAFALEETGAWDEAEKMGREAVERNGEDLWAIHAVAHVYEMQGNLDLGRAWLNQDLDRWDDRNPFKDHLWWHTALFALEKGEFSRVLELYDSAIWPDKSTFYLDVQNAASMLVRLEFAGVDVGKRWDELAEVAEERQGDHVLTFTEPHYAMAFGRTGRFDAAGEQIASLCRFAKEKGHSAGATVERIVAPLCEALLDYYRGAYGEAVERMMKLRYEYQPIGGSHAQRDVFGLFLIDAAERGGNLHLARSLLEERVARHRNSYGSWRRYAGICEGLGDRKGAEHAGAQASRIANTP